MERTRRTPAAATLLALALVLAACGATGTGAPSSAPEAPSDPAAAAALPDTGESVDGDGCADLAAGPWTNRTSEADLLQGLRDGKAPPFLGALGGLDFEVREYPTVADYDDPSTIRDMGALRAAWSRAGYQEGVDWRHGGDGDVADLTLLRFRDDGGARAALSALATDYCSRAFSASLLDDRSGLTVLRKTGAVRTMFVVDDVLVSVMSCGCYGSSLAERQDLIERWTAEAMDALGTEVPSSPSS
ncbi:MAG: hypothetical protein R2702_05030 [Acidimicrobiales bacterium]